MPEEKLEEYISEQLREGVSKEEIKSNLLSAGHDEEEIEEAMTGLDMDLSVNQGKGEISDRLRLTMLVIAATVIILLAVGLIYAYTSVDPEMIF